MNVTKDSIVVGIILFLLIGLCVGLFTGIFLENGKMKKDAVDQRVARYVCNPVTGDTTFQWGYGCFTNMENTVIEK
jgi:hypothetical protein